MINHYPYPSNRKDIYINNLKVKILEYFQIECHKYLYNIFKSSKFVTLTNTSNGADLSFNVRDGLLIITNNKINIQYVL